VYFGTGNPGLSCKPSTANASRYPDSIIALKATAPTLMGWFQAIPNDKRDFDFGSSPILTTTATQKWVAEGSKVARMALCISSREGRRESVAVHTASQLADNLLPVLWSKPALRITFINPRREATS
jgi:hypothetical protein